MCSTKTFVAVAALVAMSMNAQAGLFGHHKGCGASKCCDCAPTFQPDCCRPTITRPCCKNVYNYQRSCAKPMNCCDGCGPSSCCPAGNGCNNGCAPACTAPCGNGCNNGCAPACAAPCGNGCNNACAAPCGNNCAPACAAPCGNGCAPVCSTGCGKSHKLFGGHKLFGNHCHKSCDSCCATTDCGAPSNCCSTDDCCPCVDTCKLAELIYESQTACYPRQRKHAIEKLGNRYDCACNPEVMSALIYALNDADPHVRAEAADEIGDQLRKNPCCCSQCVVNALTCALADCAKPVVRQAEQALRACGYDVVDGCCDTCDSCCNNGCCPAGCAPAGSAPAAAPKSEQPAPAPAPPAEEKKAYFPAQTPSQATRPTPIRNGLSNLFSLVD